MKHIITIAKTHNGWLVVKCEFGYKQAADLVPDSWSFNSLEKAIAQIRVLMKEHRAESK